MGFFLVGGEVSLGFIRLLKESVTQKVLTTIALSNEQPTIVFFY